MAEKLSALRRSPRIMELNKKKKEKNNFNRRKKTEESRLKITNLLPRNYSKAGPIFKKKEVLIPLKQFEIIKHQLEAANKKITRYMRENRVLRNTLRKQLSASCENPDFEENVRKRVERITSFYIKKLSEKDEELLAKDSSISKLKIYQEILEAQQEPMRSILDNSSFFESSFDKTMEEFP